MSRRAVVAVAGILAASLATRAQDQTPSFRAGVDLVRLDVSVLDKDRRPVQGLAAADFTVLENGKPQHVVTVSSVAAADRDPPRSAWMRYATRDVAANDLADELGDGRLFAIVFDDLSLPPDDADILLTARSAARHIVDLLGPSDRAAVVFAQDAGKTQDFTDDHGKLLDAIDRLQPHDPFSIEPTPNGPGPGGGDMAQRFSPLLARSPCLRNEPVLPALDAVVSQLAAVPGRRKTLFYLGVGVVLGAGRGTCDATLTGVLRDVLRRAQRANVNIHGLDPGGYDSYRQYLLRQGAAREQEGRIGGRRLPSANVDAMHDFIRTIASNTGGRAVIDTDAIEPAVDRIFEEDGSYYLIGYEPSNPAADGKFRKVEVSVARPGATVRTMSGYWAPEPSGAQDRRGDQALTSLDLSLAGLASGQGIPLRVSAVPLAASTTPRQADVGIALTVRWPSIRAAMADTLTIVRTIYDADGRPGPPVQELLPVTIQPDAGGETHVDVRRQVPLPPGRYQFRFNVKSAKLNQEGSVYADVEVPDFGRAPLSLSGVVLGAPADALAPAEAAWPVVPTTARDFSSGEHLESVVRVFQGGDAPPAEVAVTTEIFDAADVSHFSVTHTLAAERFGTARSVADAVALPLDRLASGPYLLSVTASGPGGRKTRRDLIFRMR